MALLSVMLIKHLWIEFWKSERRGRDGENKERQMMESESGGRNKSGLSLFDTVISHVGDCFNSHSGALSCTLCNSSHHLSASFAEHEHNVWIGEEIGVWEGACVNCVQACLHLSHCRNGSTFSSRWSFVHDALECKAPVLLLTLCACSHNKWKPPREQWTSQRAPNSLTN